MDAAQPAREVVHRGIGAIFSEFGSRAAFHLKDDRFTSMWPEILSISGEGASLNETLVRWADMSPRPTVLLLDEIDSLVGDTLISVLRQIRSGYDRRPAEFPQPVVLCGVRDIRDYRIHSSKKKEIITGGSAFNIKVESLRLLDFSVWEVEHLLECHTKETGQVFTREAKDAVWASHPVTTLAGERAGLRNLFSDEGIPGSFRCRGGVRRFSSQGKPDSAPGDPPGSADRQAPGREVAPGDRSDSRRGCRNGPVPSG